MRKTKDSFWYSVWRWFLCRCLELFYRRMDVNGLQNIPNDKPVIFACNHTNAMIDALIITYFSGKQSYFMTRGDIFRIPFIGTLFRSWRMLPLMRLKDGYETIAQNNAVMEFITNKLVNGSSMIIFPEGSHFWKRQVHPLRKGLARMAFEVLERDPESELVIIPVGLYYNNMIGINQDVLINFGMPILLKDFPKEENIQKNYLHFNKHLHEVMKEQMIHINLEEEVYEQVEQWRKELAERLISLPLKEGYQYQQEFIRVVTENEFQKGMPDWPFTLDEILSRHELSDWWMKIEKKLYTPAWNSKLAIWIKWPFFLLSSIHFIPVFILANKLLGRIKDKTFHASVKFALALLVQPFLAILQGTLLAWIIGSWWILPLYLLLMPVWATLFVEWRGRKNYAY